MTRCTIAVLACLTLAVSAATAPADDAKLPDPPPEPKDPYMGEYVGTFTPAGGEAVKAEAKVIGYVDKKTKDRYWHVVLLAGEKRPERMARLRATETDGKLTFSGPDDWSGELGDGKLKAKGKPGSVTMEFTVRKSPTLGAKPPAGATVLLPYEPGKAASLEAWQNKKWQPLSDGSVLVRKGSNTTKASFGSFKLHVEFYCPYQPAKTGQGRSNSGCYMHRRYEVQVLDSFGLEMRKGDCGAIYGVKIADVNASLPPGRWQTYDITFRAPEIGADGKVKSPPIFEEVRHNGVVIHKDVKVPGATRAAKGKGLVKEGPLMLQDHGNPVRYRNIWLVEK